jgi:hypothetical protein
MNTNLTTDPISYNGWTREWSTKYNTHYWYNSTTDASEWKDPVWQELPYNGKSLWFNKMLSTKESKVFDDPWLHQVIPKYFEVPEKVWGENVYVRDQVPMPQVQLPSPVNKSGQEEWKDNFGDKPPTPTPVWGDEEWKDNWGEIDKPPTPKTPNPVSPQIQQVQEPQIQEPLLNDIYDLSSQDVVEQDFKNTQDPKKQLEYIVSYYLKNKNQIKNFELELEGRFGTRGKSITRIQFNNVITKLLSMGFIKSKKEQYRLTANLQYLNNKTGEYKYSSIRPEITNLNTIQKFCKEDDLNSIITSEPFDIKFNQKNPIYVNSEKLNDAIFNDFNFSVSCKRESTLSFKTDTRVYQIVKDWPNSKKTFRYINRIPYEHSSIPGIKFELSIVRSTTTPTYKISDSNIFTSPEKYEIEFEIMNNNIENINLIALIHKMSTYVLCGLQGTNYPISISKQEDVLLKSYMKIIYPDPEKTFKHAYPNNFIGPSPCTLQRSNIKQNGIHENTNEPNIRQNYSVTDKADGERYLMLIDGDGKIYLIDQAMNVIFTGSLTKNEKLFNTIIDGELIIHDKNKNFINLFAAFDIYYINNTKVRHFPLMKTDTVELPDIVTEEKASRDKKMLYRYDLLQEAISLLSPVSVVQGKKSPMRFTVKTFYVPLNGQTIFDCCKTILENQNTMEYFSDGLIFTPTLFGVGSNQINKDGPFKKKTWDQLFKWKPSTLNTIDFLVETVKDPSGQDTISSVFKDGDNKIHQFKSLVLKCGYNENTDGYINPCLDIINGLKEDARKEDGEYKPMRFYPSNPSNNMAGVCNIIVSDDFKMFTKDVYGTSQEIFEDDMIIEFRFDKEKYDQGNVSLALCWVPIRVRYDKTEEYRKAKLENQFRGPNAYRTANENWYSINYPITPQMITSGEITGENIAVETTEDVYYKNGDRNTHTTGLRDFHNLFVKNILIKTVSNPGNTLIDYACGKGGDIPKWIDARLSFVFGVDISKDNLENRMNGSCARYLNYRKKYLNTPDALFVTGDSSSNIRDGSALKDELSKKITSAIFGQGEKNEDYLGRGVYKHFGDGMNGFNISSCQFALHYFFKTPETFHNFIRNLAECTQLNGYFIGTCYDGQSVFKKLKQHRNGDSIEFYKNKVKICQIVKNYDDDVFEEDESCIGKEILVWQDSINQMIPEYLVNFNYLVRIMENYGFTLHQPSANLEPSGSFQQLFYKMKDDVKANPHREMEYRNALSMSDVEKEVSFLNRYFIFQKIREVDAAKIAIQFIERISDPQDYQNQNQKLNEVKQLEQTIVLQPEKVKPVRKPRTLKATATVEQAQAVEQVPLVLEPPPPVVQAQAVVQAPSTVAPKRGRPKKADIVAAPVAAPAVAETVLILPPTAAPAAVKKGRPTKKVISETSAVPVKRTKKIVPSANAVPSANTVVNAVETNTLSYQVLVEETDNVLLDLLTSSQKALTDKIVITALENKLRVKLTTEQKEYIKYQVDHVNNQ